MCYESLGLYFRTEGFSEPEQLRTTLNEFMKDQAVEVEGFFFFCGEWLDPTGILDLHWDKRWIVHLAAFNYSRGAQPASFVCLLFQKPVFICVLSCRHCTMWQRFSDQNGLIGLPASEPRQHIVRVKHTRTLAKVLVFLTDIYKHVFLYHRHIYVT